MARGLILEGAVGSGRAGVLESLLKHPRVPGLLGAGRFFKEEETIGDLDAELQDVQRTDVQRCGRLRRVMQALAQGNMEHGGNCGFVLERFHPSYFARMPNWRLYRNIDEALHRLDARLVFLVDGSGGAGTAEDGNRREFFATTLLKSRVIDVPKKDPAACADEIVRFWSEP